MYNRQKYKKFALQQLNKRWAVPVLMTVVIFIILFIFQLPEMIKNFRSDDFLVLLNRNYDNFRQLYLAVSDYSGSRPVSNISLLTQIIVEAILSYAALNVYIKMSRSPEKVTFGDFIEGFNNWSRATLATLWQTLWIFIWGLLFFILGLIKAIAYSQMKFIVTEYENVSVTKAMRISMIITEGHKMDLFLTYLSFIGWIFLSLLTAGIGFVFFFPYKEMTMVNAYHALMKEALERGKLLPEDLE